jgi:putative tryptophan/tyrosine transport system substrate-binding protein
VAACGASAAGGDAVIGVLLSTSPDLNADFLRIFREGLKETGFVEGENVAIAYRWAENQLDRLYARI